MDSIKSWLSRIRAVNTPVGGIELGEPEPEVATQSEAVQRLVRHLLHLKAVGLSLADGERSAATTLLRGINSLSSYLRVHHALLPEGKWKEQIARSINEIVVLQGQIQSGDIEPHDAPRLCAIYFERFLDTVDATLKELANEDA
jgi:hypothetical protein